MGKINKSTLTLLLTCGVFGLVSSLLFQNCGEAFRSSSSLSPGGSGNGLQNPAPIAKDAAITLDEDSVKQGQLAATSTSNSLLFKVAGTSQKGTIVVNLDGSFVYTPFTNANGEDSFTFTVTDGNLTSNEATVTLTINPVNDLPEASNGTLNTNQNVSINAQLVAQDMDGDQLTYEIVTAPTKGTIQNLVVSSGKFTFVPNGGVTGEDSFTFRAKDSAGASAAATVKVNLAVVNVAPVAQNLVLTTLEGSPVNGKLLASDANGDQISFAITQAPTNGTLQGFNATTGTFTYVPKSQYNGSDTIVFTATDGNLTSIAKTVTITVSSVNHSPVAKNSSVSTNMNTAVTFDLMASDSDGDPLKYTILTQPKSGSLSLVSGKTYKYAPNSGYLGSDSLSFKVNDGTLDSAVATVSFSVTMDASLPPPLIPTQVFPMGDAYPIKMSYGQFVDKTGNIYLLAGPEDFGGLTSATYYVQKYTSMGRFVSRFAIAFGSQGGQLVRPGGILLDSIGNILILDSGNNRVQKFSSTGTFLSQFSGAGANALNQPKNFAIDAQNNIYVADLGNNVVNGVGEDRIIKFNSSGTFLLKFGKKAASQNALDGEFYFLKNLIVDIVGNVYASDASSRIQKFDSQGKFLLKFIPFDPAIEVASQIVQIGSMGIDSKNNLGVTVMDNGSKKSFRKVTASGVYLGAFPAISTTLVELVTRNNKIFFDYLDNIYFDGKKFNAKGDQFLLGYPNRFRVDELVVDSAANLFVVDSYSSTSKGYITKYSSKGDKVVNFGAYGTLDGQISGIRCVAADSKNSIYAIDATSRLQKFDNNGKFLFKRVIQDNGQVIVAGSQLCIATDPFDNVYVGYANPASGLQQNIKYFVQKFDSNGNLVGKIALATAQPIVSGSQIFYMSLWKFVVDSQGNFFFLDGGQKRLQKFDATGSLIKTIVIDSVAVIQNDIAIDKAGSIYIPSFENKIHKFDGQGNLLATLGAGQGTDNGQISAYYYVHLDVDPLGNIYIGDENYFRVQKMSPAGASLFK